MAVKIPIRTVYSGEDPVGLSEFQSGEAVGYAHGGTGLTTLGTAGQILKINDAGTAIVWGTDEQRDLSTYITSATVSSTYVANTVFQSALANTNSYIATNYSTERAALANTNSYIATALANTNSYIATNYATERAALANSNSYIATNYSTERAALANTNIYIATNYATERAALANTNIYIAATLANTNSYIATKFDSANVSITNDASTITSAQGSLDQEDEILANPAGFITINLGGTNYKLPYYS